MKKFIKWLMTPVIFKQWENGTFSKFEIFYFTWVIALIPAVYRSGTTVPLGFPDTPVEYGWTILSLIPVMFVAFIMIRARSNPNFYELSDIPNRWWITKLCLSLQWWFIMSVDDVLEIRKLKQRFLETYGVPFDKIKFHWTHRFQFVILLVVTISFFFLGVNI